MEGPNERKIARNIPWNTSFKRLDHAYLLSFLRSLHEFYMSYVYTQFSKRFTIICILPLFDLCNRQCCNRPVSC